MRLHVEDGGCANVENVAGLVVQQRRVLRLELVLGRRLDVVHLTAVARLHAKRSEALRVRRPDDGPRVVRVALGALTAQCRARLAPPGRPDTDIVVSYE